MIGGARSSNQTNPNYDYDSRNDIPMMDRDSTSAGGLNVGMESGDERRGQHHSSPLHRNYGRDLIDQDGKRHSSPVPESVCVICSNPIPSLSPLWSLFVFIG